MINTRKATDFSLKHNAPENTRSACQIITDSQARKLSPGGMRVDKASKGFLSSILKRGDMEGKAGQTLLLPSIPGLAVQRVLLVGCGKESEMNERVFARIIDSIATALANCGARDAEFYPADVSLKGRDLAWKIRQAALLLSNAEYRFEQLKSSKPSPRKGLRKLNINVANKDASRAKQAINEATAISAGMSLARDLGNLPANVCTPSYIAKQARLLAKGEKRLRVNVLDEADMKRLKMGSLLSVSAGSRQPAKLISLEYRGAAAKQQPVALVGKGVTFDTGGISLKQAAEMDEMKYDMCGAASVFGTLHAVSSMKLPLNVVALIPATENMPDGEATRPGDIVTSMSGQTIEILNTDAEGRLILCDALTYAERYEPSAVIDIATLTGACIVALGKVATGLFSPDDKLASELLDAGQTAWDRAWRLPVWDDYQEQLSSNFADVANIGGRPAGSVTAACFLARFAKKYRWAHLDIAGVAWKSGKEKGSTGRPVPMLSQFLMARAGW